MAEDEKNIIFTFDQLRQLHADSGVGDALPLDKLEAFHREITGGTEFMKEGKLGAFKAFVSAVAQGANIPDAVPVSLKIQAEQAGLFVVSSVEQPPVFAGPKPVLQNRQEMLHDAMNAQGGTAPAPAQPHTLDDHLAQAGPLNPNAPPKKVSFEKAVNKVAEMYIAPGEIFTRRTRLRRGVIGDIGRLFGGNPLEEYGKKDVPVKVWKKMPKEEARKAVVSKIGLVHDNIDMDELMAQLDSTGMIRTNLDRDNTIMSIYSAAGLAEGDKGLTAVANTYDALVAYFPHEEVVAEVAAYAAKWKKNPEFATPHQKLSKMKDKAAKIAEKAEKARLKAEAKAEKRKKPVPAPQPEPQPAQEQPVEDRTPTPRMGTPSAHVQASAPQQPASDSGIMGQTAAQRDFSFSSVPEAHANQTAEPAPQPGPAGHPNAQVGEKEVRAGQYSQPNKDGAGKAPEKKEGRLVSLVKGLKFWGKKTRKRREIVSTERQPEPSADAFVVPEGYADTVDELIGKLTGLYEQDGAQTGQFRAMHFDYGVAPVGAPIIKNGDITRILFDVSATSDALTTQASFRNQKHTIHEREYASKPLKEAVAVWVTRFNLTESGAAETLERIAEMYIEKAAAFYEVLPSDDQRPRLCIINPDGRKYAALALGQTVFEIYRTLMAEREKAATSSHSFTQAVDIDKIMKECYSVILSDESDSPSLAEKEKRREVDAILKDQIFPSYGIYTPGAAQIQAPAGTDEEIFIANIVTAAAQAYRTGQVPQRRMPQPQVAPAEGPSQGTVATQQLQVAQPPAVDESDLIPLGNAERVINEHYGTYTTTGVISQAEVEAELKRYRKGVVQNSRGEDCFRKSTLEAIARKNARWLDRDKEGEKIKRELADITRDAEEKRALLARVAGRMDHESIAEYEKMMFMMRAKTASNPYSPKFYPNPQDEYDQQEKEACQKFQDEIANPAISVLDFTESLNRLLEAKGKIANVKYLHFYQQVDDQGKNLEAMEARLKSALDENSELLDENRDTLDELEDLRREYRAERAAHTRFKRRVYGSIAAAALVAIAVGGSIFGPRIYSSMQREAEQKAVCRKEAARFDNALGDFNSRMDSLMDRLDSQSYKPGPKE